MPPLHSTSCSLFAAGIACIAPAFADAEAAEPTVLTCPEDMLRLWETMWLNLQDSAKVTISPEWGVAPKQAIGITMQDLNADSYGCDWEPLTGIVTIRPKYSSTAKLIAAHFNPELRAKLTDREIQALDKAHAIVAELITPDMGDYEKVLVLHDYIVDHADFTRPMGDDCVEMLLSGKGVCEGYARALRVLLTIAGVDNRFAFGEAKGENHLWNLVCVDGLWYHVDPTWDDGMGAHGYFMLTDDELAADHHWDRSRFHATATQGHLYYARLGLCPDSYEALWQALTDAWESGADHYECYFTTEDDYAAFRGHFRDFALAHPDIEISGWWGPHQTLNVLHVRFRRQPKENR